MITGRIKACIAMVIFACLVLISLAPMHALEAGGETRYELISGGVTFGNDAILLHPSETLFHQQTLATMDNENMDISFPGSLNFSRSRGVDLALPSISQTVNRSVSSSSVGFFYANTPFYPCCNFGAAPVGVGQFGKPSPVTPAAFSGSALMYPEMINRGNLVHGTNNTSTSQATPAASSGSAQMSTEMINQEKLVQAMHYTSTSTNINNPRLTLPPSLAADAYGEVEAINASMDKNISAANATSPALLSEQKFNLNANASQINNSSIVERMWRNSHLSNLMDDVYEGDSSSPIWIAPQENMSETLQRTDHKLVMQYALNMTQPGKYLTKAFWDL